MAWRTSEKVRWHGQLNEEEGRWPVAKTLNIVLLKYVTVALIYVALIYLSLNIFSSFASKTIMAAAAEKALLCAASEKSWPGLLANESLTQSRRRL